MAKISKQWGTIIACWAVALTFIIAGICLGVIIPSKAAEDVFEGDIAVMFDGETTIYHNMNTVLSVLEATETTVGKPLTIKLLSNVTSGTVQPASGFVQNKNFILDLNGYVWSADGIFLMLDDTDFHIIDSCPEVVRYCTYTGEDYQLVTSNKIGYTGSVVQGGVIALKDKVPTDLMANLSVIVGHGSSKDVTITIDGGTFLGNSAALQVYAEDGFTAKLIINGGNLQFTTDEMGSDVTFSCANNGKIEINGGNIYGKIFTIDITKEEDTGVIFGLDDIPADAKVTISENIELKPQYGDDGSILYYQAVTKGSDEPITAPTEPVKDAEPKADSNNSNLIGLIILGAAAVMVVGVTTIIVVNVKRRKKVA